MDHMFLVYFYHHLLSSMCLQASLSSDLLSFAEVSKEKKREERGEECGSDKISQNGAKKLCEGEYIRSITFVQLGS